ncbi:MAG: DUF4012 domain-containing protein [Candidatus Daviesbacteria bacterium]|nr:DUF4012 domain-containing protein [Candidatus Daviesbacteria bacterium]
MADLQLNSIEKDSILLARNQTVALVVGAAGFIGSHLSERLLDKNIQVIGVDDLSTGKKFNLDKASKNKDFHFINNNAAHLKLELTRLDYIFIITGKGWDLGDVLALTKRYGSKLVFVSTLELYDSEAEEDLSWFKKCESQVAQFASLHKLNARVVRLTAVYGPRMIFKVKDPLIKLIQESLNNKLQKDNITEFSTRALFIDDATELIIKSMLSGSTAQKIFDGCLASPIKVAEVKQVLLDPIWYDSRGFEPSELPPWPSPNLDKTMKVLSWRAKSPLVKSLKETINYFRDNEIETEEPSQEKDKFFERAKVQELPKTEIKDPTGKKRSINLEKPIQIVALGLIFYALIWPVTVAAVSFFDYKNNMDQIWVSVEKGDFEQARIKTSAAGTDLDRIGEFVNFFDPLKDFPLMGSYLKSIQYFLAIADNTTEAVNHVQFATQELYLGWKAVTGELTEAPDTHFIAALQEYSQADELIGRAQTKVQKGSTWENKVKQLASLTEQGRILAGIMPQIVATNSKKSYLVLLENNQTLRPSGGVIQSYVRIDFEKGKLKRLEINSVDSLDKQLLIHVEPPKEIKEDLKTENWLLRDSNFEPDFPTSARQAEWFYTKETAVRPDGVVGMDLQALAGILSAIGPMDIPGFSDKVSADNLIASTLTNTKGDFITALVNQIFNRLLFLPNQNWPGVVNSFGKSLQQKHLSFYLDDPKLFAYLVSQNWAGALPRPETEVRSGEFTDFLAPVESNMSTNQANYYIERSYSLSTTINKENLISHRLKITYTNRSSKAGESEIYKNRLRLYLPFGARINRALLGETDLTSKVSSFSDYGRSGYSLLFEIRPKETKALVIDYQLSGNLSFEESNLLYRLDVIKQLGTNKDPFEWRLTYPANYTINSSQGKANNPQEFNITSDLSEDRSFEITLRK